jgi:ABC-type transport system involved in multi-copper enzyme maturation permease subunit
LTVLILIWGTIRELSGKATLYVLAGISTVILLFVLLAVSSATTDAGESTILLFGNPVSPPNSAGDLPQIVRSIEAGLTGGLFFGIVLFGLFATAGLVPDALEKGIVDLYLSKPIARSELLLGKFLGGTIVILLNILYFIGCLWLLLGLKLGVWNFPFLYSTLPLTFAFACLFTIAVFFGVLARNMAIAIIAVFAYLFIFAGALESRVTGLYLLSENALYRRFLDGLYYALPQVLGVQHTTMGWIIGKDMLWQPFLQSFLSSGAILALSIILLRRKDF